MSVGKYAPFLRLNASKEYRSREGEDAEFASLEQQPLRRYGNSPDFT